MRTTTLQHSVMLEKKTYISVTGDAKTSEASLIS